MRFCKDCKYSKDVGGGPYKLTCESPKNVVETINEEKFWVSGIKQPMVLAMRGVSCLSLRMKRIPEMEALVCGPDAKWFEPKETL